MSVTRMANPVLNLTVVQLPFLECKGKLLLATPRRRRPSNAAPGEWEREIFNALLDLRSKGEYGRKYVSQHTQTLSASTVRSRSSEDSHFFWPGWDRLVLPLFSPRILGATNNSDAWTKLLDGPTVAELPISYIPTIPPREITEWPHEVGDALTAVHRDLQGGNVLYLDLGPRSAAAFLPGALTLMGGIDVHPGKVAWSLLHSELGLNPFHYGVLLGMGERLNGTALKTWGGSAARYPVGREKTTRGFYPDENGIKDGFQEVGATVGNPVRPRKLGKPLILLEVLAEGGSIKLLTAEVLAWEDPKAPTGGYATEYRPPNREVGVPVWEQDVVFWVESDERSLAAFFDESDLPDELMRKTDFRREFDEALHEFMDPYQWWSWYPGRIHSGYMDAFTYELSLRFPGWEKDLEQYSKDWSSCHEWHARLLGALQSSSEKATEGCYLDKNGQKQDADFYGDRKPKEPEGFNMTTGEAIKEILNDVNVRYAAGTVEKAATGVLPKEELGSAVEMLILCVMKTTLLYTDTLTGGASDFSGATLRDSRKGEGPEWAHET